MILFMNENDFVQLYWDHNPSIFSTVWLLKIRMVSSFLARNMQPLLQKKYFSFVKCQMCFMKILNIMVSPIVYYPNYPHIWINFNKNLLFGSFWCIVASDLSNDNSLEAKMWIIELILKNEFVLPWKFANRFITPELLSLKGIMYLKKCALSANLDIQFAIETKKTY